MFTTIQWKPDPNIYGELDRLYDVLLNKPNLGTSGSTSEAQSAKAS